MIGVVTNNDDPESQGRVRVSYPALGDGVEGWWARVLVLGAGRDRGVAMSPVPGDEVLLGFEHGDPRRPVVLGGLFNGTDLPGELISADGSLAVRSPHDAKVRAGQLLELKSDAKAGLEAGSALTVRGGSTVEVDASGQLTLKGATVTIESSGPLKLSAPTVMVG